MSDLYFKAENSENIFNLTHMQNISYLRECFNLCTSTLISLTCPEIKSAPGCRAIAVGSVCY